MTSTLLIVGLLAAAACTSSPEQSTPTTDQTRATPPTTAASDLTVDHFNDGVFCDGSERRAVIIFGAEPGETITFTSPMPVQIGDGAADDQGHYQLLWACDATEAGLQWDLTATGAVSNRTVSFQIVGSYDDPVAARTMTFTASGAPLVCDGARHVVGELQEADRYETIEFTAANKSSLLSGVTDSNGALLVRWSCGHEDIKNAQQTQDVQDTQATTGGEATWVVQAVGQTSGKLATLELAGQAPRPARAGGIEVELVEEPVICDRSRRRLAVLQNLTPLVEVGFAAVPASDPIRNGSADQNGSLHVYWQCHRADSDTTWELTATEQTAVGGSESARSVAFTFSGTATPNSTTITVSENPFRCDGTSHQFGVLSNFLPGEYIDFDSPQSNNIRQGQANAAGELPLRWQCLSTDIGTTWDLTATGKTSGLSLQFAVTGGP